MNKCDDNHFNNILNYGYITLNAYFQIS